jgi:hypothetical protein
MPFQSQASPDTAVAVNGAVLDNLSNGLFDDSVIVARRSLSQVCAYGRAISFGQHMAAQHAKGTADSCYCSPLAIWRARNPLFCFGKVNSLLENFARQSLAAKSPFQLFDAAHGFLKL